MGMSVIPAGRRGVALLMTLSMILILSVALMKVFEKRSVEVAHLGNNLSRFQAETLSRSVFRAILIAIREKGLVAVVGNRPLWQNVPFTLEGGSFQIEELKPVDHLFNLNARITSENVEVRRQLFFNLVRRIRQEHDFEDTYIFEDDISTALSALIDWTDPDPYPENVFLLDHEYYPHAEPAFEVKNREFERVTEVRLLEPFQRLGITRAPLAEYFRVHGDLTVSEFIDVNLARPGETAAFLALFEGVPGYENVYANRETLDEIVAADGGQPMEGMEGVMNFSPRFPPENFYHRVKSDWKAALAAHNITLEPKETDLFRPVTYLLRLRFSVQVGRVTVRTRALLRLVYPDARKSLGIQKIGILTYSVR